MNKNTTVGAPVERTEQPAVANPVKPTVRHRLVPTPGPWKAVGSKLGNDFGILDSTGKNVIGECFSDIRRKGEHALHEAAANARLMAAAPTLLAYYRASLRLQMHRLLPSLTKHICFNDFKRAFLKEARFCFISFNQ